jgi:hypothetical protein
MDLVASQPGAKAMEPSLRSNIIFLPPSIGREGRSALIAGRIDHSSGKKKQRLFEFLSGRIDVSHSCCGNVAVFWGACGRGYWARILGTWWVGVITESTPPGLYRLIRLLSGSDPDWLG